MPNWRSALFGLWVCLTAAVCILSLLPGSMVPRPPGGATTAHFVVYAALAAIPAAAFRPFRTAWLAILLVASLGVLLEFLQIPIPGRAFEWHDILANWLGVMVGMLAGWVLRLCLLCVRVMRPQPADGHELVASKDGE